MKLKIPTSPDSEPELFTTPNSSIINEGDSGTEELFSTPLTETPIRRSYIVTKIKSTGNIHTSKYDIINVDEDQVDSGLDENLSNSRVGGLIRMKSLGNLSANERAFGDTPKELIYLKKEFERKRFGMARMRSFSSLILDDSNEKENIHFDCCPKNEIQKSSTFSSIRNSNFKKKKIGVGDTKYIGNDETDSKHHNHALIKQKSMGTITDLKTEPVHFDPFWTPNSNRRISAVKKSEKDSGSSDEDDAIMIRHHDMNELLKTPFERGYRKSHNHILDKKVINSSTPLRQSDGYFQNPQVPKIKNDALDSIRTRASLNSLPTDAFSSGWNYVKR